MDVKDKKQPNLNCEVISCDVACLGETQPKLTVDDWCGHLVIRLLEDETYQDGEAMVKLAEGLGDSEQVKQPWAMQFRWQNFAQRVEQTRNSVQENGLTEWAAIAVSCVALDKALGKKIKRATRRGDRADYWLEDGSLLEVSGQQRGNLEQLLDKKAAQLLDSPLDKPGYVSVTNFSQKRSYLCYYGSKPQGVTNES